MRSMEEITRLRDKLEEIVNIISEYGADAEVNSEQFRYLCNVVDALNWVLEKLSTDRFLSSDYLDINNWNKRLDEIRLEII